MEILAFIVGYTLYIMFMAKVIIHLDLWPADAPVDEDWWWLQHHGMTRAQAEAQRDREREVMRQLTALYARGVAYDIKTKQPVANDLDYWIRNASKLAAAAPEAFTWRHPAPNAAEGFNPSPSVTVQLGRPEPKEAP